MRIIAKLDVKPPYVVKPVHFEGLRKVGTPESLAKKYFLDGADEIAYIDIVASLYQREILYDKIKKTAEELFVPFAVGGGVQTLDEFSKLFHSGADKVVINTYALQKDPSIIDKAAMVFGSQAVVVNIEAKKWNESWECYSDCGRIRSGKSTLDWAREVQERGAGELFLQSVDKDGRQKGFDLELCNEVINALKIPVIAASGAGDLDDIKAVASLNPSGIAISSVLHYEKLSINNIKSALEI
jgi:cyclase